MPKQKGKAFKTGHQLLSNLPRSSHVTTPGMAGCRRCFIWIKYACLQGDGCSTALWRYVVLFLLLINLYAVYHHVDTDKSSDHEPKAKQVDENIGNKAVLPNMPEVPDKQAQPEPPDLSKLKCKPFQIDNPSFEDDGVWLPYQQKGGKGVGGFTFVKGPASHGKKSIKITKGGAYQNLKFPSGVKKFIFAADSRNKGISKAMSSDYSVWCDVKDQAGKWHYGFNSKFLLKSGGALHDWHERRLNVKSDRDISEARCYCMFRNYPSGEAWFDNIRLWTVPDDVEFDECHT